MDLGERPQQNDLEAERIRKVAWAKLSGAALQPARLGPYEILGVAGSGGMGVVYRARDSRLGRQVAVKVIRPDRRMEDPRRSVERLRTEARHTAQVQDPRVVPIFNIGVADGQLFVVMAFVEGVRLEKWLEADRRTVSDVLHVFTEAGEGLAAAHRVGVVHRDFKPSNVIVGPSGNVRIVDFGLARAIGESAVPSSAQSSGAQARIPSSGSLTETGAVLGTPGYMAPEQERGERVDAQADQYSFCVALRLALEHVARETKTQIPSRVTAAIERGLVETPSDRWPQMESLLAALSPRRKRFAMTSTLLLGGAAVAVLLAAQQNTTTCPQWLGLGAVWNPTRARQTEAFLRTAHGDTGDAAWPRLHARVEHYADAYADSVDTVCADESEADVRHQCLFHARRSLGVMLDAVSDAPTDRLFALARAVGGLQAPESCLAEGESERWPDDPELRAGVAGVRGAVAEARAAYEIAALERAWTTASTALSEAQSLGYAPLLVEALVLAGDVQSGRGERSDAQTHYALAYELAHSQGADRWAAQAALGMAIVAEQRGELDEDLRWLRHAEAISERAGGLEKVAGAVAVRRGRVHQLRSNHDKALEQFEIALDIARRLDPEGRLVGNMSIAVAGALAQTGRPAEAVDLMLDGRERIERAMGPNHPSVALASINLAELFRSLGKDKEQVLQFAEQAVAIYETTFGPTDPRLGGPLAVLAEVYVEAERFEDAERSASRGLKLAATAADLYVSHEERLRVALASALEQQGRLEDAIAQTEAAAASADRRRSDELIGFVRRHLHALYLRLERYDEAVVEARRSEEAYVRALGPTHRFVLNARGLVAQALTAAGRSDEAIAVASAALEVLRSSGRPDAPVEVVLLSALAGGWHAAGNVTKATARLSAAIAAVLAMPPNRDRVPMACELVALHAEIHPRATPPGSLVELCDSATAE